MGIRGEHERALIVPLTCANTPLASAGRRGLLVMIEEYARHVGHADLLRERIDGRVGL